MKTKRNINNIARAAGVPEQNMQQFISDSPWSGYDLISVLQQDIGCHPQFQQESMIPGHMKGDTFGTLDLARFTGKEQARF